MKALLMSDLYPYFCRSLEKKGYKIIPTKKINAFLEPEQRHADRTAKVRLQRIIRRMCG